ncbi:TIM barrel protein [Candidatus Pacearchaeota archaeon]|nr:TIM barrel protein [Candidatus Pacearchaeota archaeon]
MIIFGPAGLGGVKEAVSNLGHFHKLGLRACEIAFTYGIYIKNEKDAVEIGEAAKKFGIKLSIHAPYWLNLNSGEKRKIEESKSRVLECCRIGEIMGAEIVVFHAGFYGKLDRETSFQNIKKAILEMLSEIKNKKWKIKIAPETMGKINVFGSSEEILRLVAETKCSFCLDFAHLWAREKGKISYSEIYNKFKHFSELHCHFSGINFSDKGERNHKETPETEMKKLLSALPKNKNITIINESPFPVKDAEKMLQVWKKLK